MVDIFKDIIQSILVTKKNVIQDEVDLEEYKPYVVNKALSFHKDCLPYVVEMTRYHWLDKDIQYQYYLHSIRPMKRKFQEWMKPQPWEKEEVEAIMKYYGYSYNKALTAAKVLTAAQREEIRQTMEIGGLKK